MFEVKNGDLFKHATKNCIIAHGCNAQGKMGTGFAYELKLKYPQAYFVYYTENRLYKLRVGETLFVQCENRVHVANCITQEYYGRAPGAVYVDYDAVGQTLLTVARFARINNLPIHLPLIGGGRAQGNVDKLMGIYRDVLSDTDSTLWLKD